ncbi:MAG: hypothetical protein P4L87_13780 [Formivibrio sp.]|nr:hypothetical protein [Formivibrio sp.]
MNIVMALPSHLLEAVTRRIQSFPPLVCNITLTETFSAETFATLQSGDGVLILQPADFRIAKNTAETAKQARIHYGEVGLIESPQAVQQGFMAWVGGKAADLSVLAAALNALAPYPYGWWHVGEAGSAAFLLALLKQLGHAMQHPIDVSCLLPQLAQLSNTQQQCALFATEYLQATDGEHFEAIFPERQNALASFLDCAESPARQIAKMIQMFNPSRVGP